MGSNSVVTGWGGIENAAGTGGEDQRKFFMSDTSADLCERRPLRLGSGERPQFFPIDVGLPKRSKKLGETIGLELRWIGDFDSDWPAILGAVNDEHIVDPLARRHTVPTFPGQSKICGNRPSAAIGHRE